MIRKKNFGVAVKICKMLKKDVAFVKNVCYIEERGEKTFGEEVRMIGATISSGMYVLLMGDRTHNLFGGHRQLGISLAMKRYQADIPGRHSCIRIQLG